MNYISRTLTYKDKIDNLKSITDDELLNIKQSVVILAEPGMGKTSLLEHLENSENTVKFTASSFVRRPLVRLKNIENKVVLIDALDEYQSDKNSNSIDNILTKLYELDSPQFILTCRAVEWDEASNSIFEDFYDEKPIVAHIEAFTRGDAIKFLNEHNNFSGNSENIIHQLDELSLTDFYNNPLTLELLTHVDINNLPDNKADIFDLATRNLWQEINDSAPNKLQQTDENTIIECSGFICATLLLSQKQNIFTGNISKTPDDALSIHKLKSIFDEDFLSNTIKCRIFKLSIDNQNFRPMHRTIAEFLGARWLAKKMSDSMVKKRLLEQFTYKDGVPSSLRGMFSWLAYFNPILTDTVISIDPYGLIIYADTSFFSNTQSRLMYKSLKKLAEINPWFRQGNWHDLKVKGLANPCLIDEYRQLLSDKESNSHLRLSIIQILQDADFVSKLSNELIAIMMDITYRYSERSVAFQLVYDKNIAINWPDILNKLIDRALEDDLKLVCELMVRDNYSIITDEQVIQLLLNSQPLEKGTKIKSYVVPNNGSDYYFRNFPIQRTLSFIDKLVIAIYQLNISRFEVNHEATKNINRIILLLLKKYASQPEMVIPISTFYDSTSIFYHFKTGIDSSKYSEYKNFFDEYFSNNPLDKFAIQKLIIDNEERISYRFWELRSSVLYSLYPELKDIKSLIEYIQTTPINHKNIETWKTLVGMSCVDNSIPNTILEAINPYILNNNKLLNFVHLKTQPLVKEDLEIENESRVRKEKLNIKLSHQRLRNKLRQKETKLKAGDFKYCYQPAHILLEDHYDIPSELRGSARLNYILKEALSISSIIGLKKSLSNSIPEPISFVIERHPCIETILIAGIYCRIIDNENLDNLNNKTIISCAIIIELNNFLYFDSDAQNQLSDLIDKEIFSRNLKNDLIESLLIPQLERNYDSINGLRWLTNTNVSDKDIEKTIEIISKYSNLKFEIQRQLIESVIKNKSINKLEYVIKSNVHSIEELNNNDDVKQASFWLSLYSYVDEKDFFKKIVCFDNPTEVFWQLNKLYQNTGHLKQLTCSNLMKEWIIYRFSDLFPKQEVPRYGVYGSHNLYDGTEFISSLLASLSNTPTDEAYQSLKSLQSFIHISYKEYVKYLLTNQKIKLREHGYVPPTLENLLNIYKNEPPENCKDLKALVVTLLDEIQAEIYGSETDPHKAFYQSIIKDEKNIPHGENDCRDRLVDLLKPKLQTYFFSLETERDMPDDKRADIVCKNANLQLPIEVKGQWHKKLWTAMNDQLGDLYLKEHQAQGQGIYLLFWFGKNVIAERSLNTTAFNKTGISGKPNSARELKLLLDDRTEDKYKDGIEIYVMDISRD